MPAERFPAQHCTCAGDDAGKSDQNMKTDDAQEHRRGRGYLNPRDDRCSGHDVRPHKGAGRAVTMGFIYQNRLSRSPPYFAANADCERASGHSRAGLDFV